MSFPKCFLLVAATVLLAQYTTAGLVNGALNAVKQTAGGLVAGAAGAGAVTKLPISGTANLITGVVSNKFEETKKKFDTKAAIGGDGNVVISLLEKGVQDLEDYAALHSRNGTIGCVIEILRQGWEDTMKSVGHGLDEAFDLFDSFLEKDITDKQAALAELDKAAEYIIHIILRSGTPVHFSLGAGKTCTDYADKGNMKVGIDMIQETGTELFANFGAGLHEMREGIESDDKEILKKCILAAHAILKSAAVAARENLRNGARLVIEYLSSAKESVIKSHESVEGLISSEVKKAADNDKDTVEALKQLDIEFDSSIKQGLNSSILKSIKNGLVEYIRYAAWTVALLNNLIEEITTLAKTDPQAAIKLVENVVKIGKESLIAGSIKCYEGLGYAGRMTNLVDSFLDAIEHAERIRIEGTKGIDMVGTVLIKGITTGGAALEAALEAAHKAIEANESVLFGQIEKVRDVACEAMRAHIEQ